MFPVGCHEGSEEEEGSMMTMEEEKDRITELCSEEGASSWLTALPLKSLGFKDHYMSSLWHRLSVLKSSVY